MHSASPSQAVSVADRLVLLPAVDVAGGQAVQLVQGRAGSENVSVTPEPRPSAGRTREPNGFTWSI